MVCHLHINCLNLHLQVKVNLPPFATADEKEIWRGFTTVRERECSILVAILAQLQEQRSDDEK